MRPHVVLIVSCFFISIGCGKGAREPRVTYVDENDPEMKAAIDKARESLPDFIQALKSPKPTQSMFSIKAPFSDGEDSEHIWLTPVSYDGEKFHGTISNRPDKLTNVRLGTKVTLEPKQLSDWMYLEGKRLVGGYTIRVLRKKMSDQERMEFDRVAPFIMDSGPG
jgi:uncharacterized protein YegJ (DUF2314 family)